MNKCQSIMSYRISTMSPIFKVQSKMFGKRFPKILSQNLSHNDINQLQKSEITCTRWQLGEGIFTDREQMIQFSNANV